MQRTASLSSYRPLNQLRPGSFSLGDLPPQSSFAQISRGHLSTAAYLPRVSSLIAASLERVHIREGCQAFATFRPQAFAASRRFPPPSGFAGLFHPAATSRVVAVQGLLSPRSRLLHQQSVPPCRCHPEHSPDLALRFAFALRLPPDATLVDASTSRPSSARGSVAYGLGLASPQPAPLFGFHLLQAVNHRLGFGSPKPPAHDVVSPRLLSPGSTALSVFQRRARFLSLPRNQPARDFRAFRPKSPW
jgi:hypothetical protein